MMVGYRKNLIVDPLDVFVDKALTGDLTCDGATCHRTDDSASGAYDANPLP